MLKTDSRSLTLLHQMLQRIFLIKVNRSTFREVQSAFLQFTEGNQQEAQSLFESIVRGVAPDGIEDESSKALFEDIAKDFSTPIRFSREVAERAEFLRIITSDAMTKADSFAFLHRILRIDGDEFSFATDLEGSLSLIQHLIDRLGDLKKTDKGKAAVEGLKKPIDNIKSSLDSLTS